MTNVRASFWRRHKVLGWVAGIALAAFIVLVVVVSIVARRTEPFLRARIVDALSEHFHARVELDSFHLRFGNGLRGEWGVWADGRGLRIWPPAGDAAPGWSGTPLIRLDEFRFHAPLRYTPGMPVHISEVRLNGLDIDLPPKSHAPHEAASPSETRQTFQWQVIPRQLPRGQDYLYRGSSRARNR